MAPLPQRATALFSLSSDTRRRVRVRLFVQLLISIGLALFVLAAGTTTKAAGRGVSSERSATFERLVSARSAGARVEAEPALPGHPDGPSSSSDREAREASTAMKAALASEGEDEQEDAASWIVSASPHVRCDVLDPPGSPAPAIDTGRRSIATGLGRGPPQRR